MEKILDLLKGYAVSYGIRIIVAFFILFLGLKLVSFITKRMKSRTVAKNIEPGAAGFLSSVLSYSLKALVIITSIGILGVPMTSVITVLGTASLAVGLALQGSLANFAGGFMILMFKPFRVGDYIDDHAQSGTVKEIGVFYTTLETPDKKIITVPNGALANAAVVNYSASETRRVDFMISVSGEADIEKAKKTLLLVAQNHKLTLQDPPPFVYVSAHEEYAEKLTLWAWCEKNNYWPLYFDLMGDIKQALNLAGIEPPVKGVYLYEKK